MAPTRAAWSLLLVALWLLPTTPRAGEPRALTDGRYPSRAPAWHPGGQRIAFEVQRDGAWSIDALDLASGQISPLVAGPGDDRHPTWTPGGTRLVFVRESDGDADLYLKDFDEDSVSLLLGAAGIEAYPDVSPDGEAIAFTVLGEPRPRVRVLGWFAEWMRDLGNGVWPRWSPSGEEIVFFSRRDTGGEDDEVYLIGRQGDQARRITHRPGHDFCPAWSPDGKRLVVVSREPDGRRALRLIDHQGQTLGRLAEGFHRVTEPDWSPDGRFIVFAGIQRQGEAYRLYLQALD